ncbi:MAG: hypothetical protein OXG19_02795 [Chloroflexi bacterium]|nr:hypothetical protein [Chloroflexota bacterium]
MQRDRTRKGLAVWILALVALGTWLGAGMALNAGLRYTPASAVNGEDPLPALITVTPSERTALPLGAPGEENPSKEWTVRVTDAGGAGVAGLLEGSFRRLYVTSEFGSRLHVRSIADAAAAGRAGDYTVSLAAGAGAAPGSQHNARVTVIRPGFGPLTALINVVIGNPGETLGPETGDGSEDDAGGGATGIAAHSTHVTSYPPLERLGDTFQIRVAPGGTVWVRVTFFDAEFDAVPDGTEVTIHEIGANPGIVVALPRGTWRSLLALPTAPGVPALDSVEESALGMDRGVTEDGSVHLLYIASPVPPPSAAPQRIIAISGNASALIEIFVGAADDEPYVLPLKQGGQFVRASFEARAADLFGDRVTVAWKYDGPEAGWIAYIPAIGLANFAIAPGDFLWVVSPGGQTLAVP